MLVSSPVRIVIYICTIFQEVSDLADECISLLLKTQSAVKRIEILTGVVDESEFPINLAALKLQFSELQCLDSNDVSQILTKVVPSLIKVGAM